MIEYKLKTRNFIIEDSEASEMIRILDISHIYYTYDYDFDGQIILVAKKPPDNTVSLTRSWMSVYKKRKIYTIMPSKLLPFIGKTVAIYRDNAFNSVDELFKIKPIDFKFKINGMNVKRININPHFTSSNTFVLPKHYINKTINGKIYISRISFDLITLDSISDGFLFAGIVDNNYAGSLVFNFSENKVGFCTYKLKRLMAMISGCGKNLNSFLYQSTIPNEINKHGVMVFEEMKL